MTGSQLPVHFKYGYDELGRIKSLTHVSGTDSLTTTNSYNIRSWLTGIDSPIFKQKLHYTDGVGTPYYNGNISSMTWQTDVSTIHGYQFSYDGLSRLSNAVYGEGNTLSINRNRSNEQVTGYDKMGNILGLKRFGQTSVDGYGLIDDLLFFYNGIQLKSVEDESPNSAYAGGFEFKDTIHQSIEYAYDSNGNLIQDLNKNITDIQYNYLNLPSRIQFANGNSIFNLYDAVGTKLRSTHITDGIATTTDYSNNAIYENGMLAKLLTGQGYISLSDTVYHYFLRDHQGNNRVVVNQNGVVEEENHYYPFGGIFSSSSSVQPYKYNGKELDRQNGLNWYDYGARMYDPAIGRWHAIDPQSEKYYASTPYNYCDNEPIGRSDPNGTDWIQDRFGYYLWDDNAVDEETTRAGWTYVGSSLSADVSHYRILEEVNGSLYHINTINPFASLVNWLAGEDLMVEKKLYGPVGDHMMQQGIETGAEMFVGEIGGRVLSKLFRAKGTNVLYKGKDANGTIRYIGITEREPAIRFAEHLNSGTTRATLKYEVMEGYTKLTREQARFWEQTFINKYGLGKNGGQLYNKINSISPKNWEQYGLK